MDKSTIIGICVAALAGYLLYRYMGNGGRVPTRSSEDVPGAEARINSNRASGETRLPSNSSTPTGRVTTQAGTTGRTSGTTGRTSGTTEPHRVGTTGKTNTRTNQNRTT